MLTPSTKPVTTGLARNSDRKPSRSSPAMTSRTPTMNARAVVRLTNSAGSPAARGVTTATDMTAMVELAVTLR